MDDHSIPCVTTGHYGIDHILPRVTMAFTWHCHGMTMDYLGMAMDDRGIAMDNHGFATDVHGIVIG